MRKTTGAVAATVSCGAVLLAACGASATVSSYIQGTWDCTSEGAEGPVVVEVGSDTFSMKNRDDTVTGTWEAAFGDLTLKIKGTDNYNFGGALLKDFPGKQAPEGSFTSTWTTSYSDGQSNDPGPLAVSIDGKKVRLVYTGRDGNTTDAATTTTTCTKR